jgi:hypothetical protein
VTVLIHQKGELEPVAITGDFNDLQNGLNIGASKGWTFITFEREDSGARVAFNLANINRIEAVDDEFEGMIG